MNFEELVGTITPKLKQLAVKYHRYCVLSDEKDLFSEMLLALWEKWNAGELEGKTESYIVQACYFHLRNHLRNVQDRRRYLRFEEPADEYRTGSEESALPLEEVVADPSQDLPGYTEGKALYEKIMNNGLSRLEKDIIGYLYDGFTVREIGRMLNISHAMVVKYKKNISEKVSRQYGHLLV